jgi:DNA (cytosine-5)-methyltransferase 1
MLKQSGKPYIIENVVGAKDDMIQPILLCGTMFGLHIARHRLFETTLQLGPFDLPPHPMCKAIQLKYATEHGINPRHMSIAGKAMNSQHTQLWRTLMDWPEGYRTSQRDLKEAIPPAYSKWIGTEMLTHLGATGRDQ